MTAYDTDGSQVLLDATRVPTRPVLVVDVYTEKALPLGLEIIDTTRPLLGPQVQPGRLRHDSSTRC
ncbi:DUF3103 family protein [Actinophytocola oryzae]|uniref:DUF3103 family protein n=1 Tax=Actinophytocola oryzae TaxID=502181 RepID=UPI001AAF6940|nr:DUF3103 family protein [Actinophytocola oryzae]